MSRLRFSRVELTEHRLRSRDVLRSALRLALPAFFSSLLTFGMNLMNYILLALFQDYQSIASYGIVSAYTTLAAGLFMPFAVTTSILLERALKKEDPYHTQSVINTCILIAVVVGVISIVFAELIAPAYIWQVLTPVEIKEMTTQFLRVFSVNFLPILFFSVTTMILIQMGQPQGPILAEISALALHASFGYIFVGLFDMGILGCAFSAILSQSVASLITLHLIQQQRRSLQVRNRIRFDKAVFKEMIKESRPALFTAFLGGIFMIFLQFYIDELGLIAIAGFTLFFVFQDFLLLPIRALNTPSRRLSANHIGAQNTTPLVRTFNPIIIIAVVYALSLIPISKLIGPPIFMFFSHYDPNVTVVAMRLVNLVAPYYIFYAVSELVSSSLEGLNHKNAVMGFNIGFNYLIRFVVLIIAASIIQGDESIAICYPVSWAICAAALSIFYYANYSKSSSIKYSI